MTLFTDAACGDLHLRNDASDAIDQGDSVPSGLCDRDFDGETRDSLPDVGADEVE